MTAGVKMAAEPTARVKRLGGWLGTTWLCSGTGTHLLLQLSGPVARLCVQVVPVPMTTTRVMGRSVEHTRVD